MWLTTGPCNCVVIVSLLSPQNGHRGPHAVACVMFKSVSSVSLGQVVCRQGTKRFFPQLRFTFSTREQLALDVEMAGWLDWPRHQSFSMLMSYMESLDVSQIKLKMMQT